MLTEDFEKLKDFILEKNTYFQIGFVHAYKDDTNGQVVAKKGKDNIILLPADSSGNYFYLRNNAEIKFNPKEAERLTDTGTQRLTFADTIEIVLVAVVRNADAFQLLENLRNTSMMHEDMDVRPASVKLNREQVLVDELKGMSDKDVEAALQRLTDQTIIQLTLKATKTFIPNECITNPITISS